MWKREREMRVEVAIRRGKYKCLCNFFGRFFFFQQKTAYEFLSGLVGAEVCIREVLRTYRAGCGKKDQGPGRLLAGALREIEQ